MGKGRVKEQCTTYSTDDLYGNYCCAVKFRKMNEKLQIFVETAQYSVAEIILELIHS